MNKIIIIAIACAIYPITACAAPSAAPTVTVTATAPASVTSTDDGQSSITPEQDYILAVRSVGNPILGTATESDLFEMGDAVCQALAAGYTVDDVLNYMADQMVQEGMTSDAEAEAVGTIIAAAVTFLCPVYNNQVS